MHILLIASYTASVHCECNQLSHDYTPLYSIHYTHALTVLLYILLCTHTIHYLQNSDLLIPWCTYTEPEVAHVGLYPRDLEERSIPYKTYTKQFSTVDRAIVEGSGSTTGFVKVSILLNIITTCVLQQCSLLTQGNVLT